MSRENDDKPFVSVIIPVRNDSRNLERCLRAVQHSICRDFECIVVDDASDDGETPAVLSRFPVMGLRNDRQRGPAYSRNRAAESARGEILFFIDADVEIRPDTIGRVARAFQNPEVDAVIGSYDDAPAATTFLSQYKNLFHHYVHQHLPFDQCTFWSGCGAIRKQEFDELGGFDTDRYPKPSIEDIELGMRLAERGGKIVLDPGLQVKHLKRWTFFNLLRTDIFARGIPWTRLLLSRRSMPNNLNVSSTQRLYVLLTLLAVAAILAMPLAAPAIGYPAILGLLALTVLVYSNRNFYRFYARKKSRAFACCVVPLHLLYFAYCGLSFGLGLLAHLLATLSNGLPRDNDPQAGIETADLKCQRP